MSLILHHYKPFDRPKETMDYSKLSHNQLIHLLGNEPRNNEAWKEFMRRYQDYIVRIIYRECKRLNYNEGLAMLDDLVQEVYVKLFRNEGQAFKTFRGDYEKAILKFLLVVAIRIVYNSYRGSRAIMRPRIVRDLPANRMEDLRNLFPDKNADDEITCIMLMLAIEECLATIGKKLRHPKRDIRIFKLYLYDGMSAESIAELAEIGLVSQSVFRIIAAIKKLLARCLKDGEK